MFVQPRVGVSAAAVEHTDTVADTLGSHPRGQHLLSERRHAAEHAAPRPRYPQVLHVCSALLAGQNKDEARSGCARTRRRSHPSAPARPKYRTSVFRAHPAAAPSRAAPPPRRSTPSNEAGAGPGRARRKQPVLQPERASPAPRRPPNPRRRRSTRTAFPAERLHSPPATEHQLPISPICTLK